MAPDFDAEPVTWRYVWELFGETVPLKAAMLLGSLPTSPMRADDLRAALRSIRAGQ